MNPASTLRFRRVTGVAAACAAIASILLSVWALIAPGRDAVAPITTVLIGSAVIVQSAANEATSWGVEPGDRIVSVDGVPILRLLRDSADHSKSDSSHTYVFEKRGGERIALRLSDVDPEFAHRPLDIVFNVALVLVSVVYLLIGSAVWRSKYERGEAWAFMLFCSSMAVELSSWVQIESAPWGVTRILVNSPFLGATAFHLFTTYPLEPGWVVRHRRIRVIPYALAALISSAVLLDQILRTEATEILATLSFFSGVGMMIFALGVLAIERRRARQAGVGDRTDVVIAAGALSLFPALLILLAQYFLHTSFPPLFAMLWMVFLPVAVGVGMMRRRRFELRLLAKSSMAYGAATLAITGLFAFMITFADQAFLKLGMTMRSAQVVFLFFAILAFNPLRDRLQRIVDGVFDRDRSRYRAAVREISEAMVSMLSLREIGDRILAAATDTMGVERAMVLLFDEDDRVLRPSAWRGDWDDQDSATEIPSEHAIWRELWMRREELCRADFDEEPDVEKREVCWDVFDALEVELLVPILFGVDLLGVIAVGRKLSGERLAADDRQLLRTLANQSAIAMENAKAFDEIAKLNETLEARVEERTTELREIQMQLMQSEKLSALGQLVAGVAHELNNPIGFVHANLQLLDEYVAKLVEAQQSGADCEPIREAIGKLLSRSREGTQRVKQIVQDLRTFTRMDQADLQEADLNEEIDRTLTLMEPRLKNGIDVVRSYGELPRVRCYPGQLNQVFLNLLMNACDALEQEQGGTIEITTSRDGDGVVLAFRDDGPGVPPELQGRLFDPFFTTKEVGKGTGLGLSLSHGIIERHHGQIEVANAPEGGAVFTVRLPLDAAPGDDLDSRV